MVCLCVGMDLVFVCVDKFIFVFREKPLILTKLWCFNLEVTRISNKIFQSNCFNQTRTFLVRTD